MCGITLIVVVTCKQAGKKIDETWYYFTSSGAMVVGWNKVGSTWYYHNASGAMLTGWQKIGGSWYLLGPDGAMKTGWQKVDDAWYYMHPATGAMISNTWIGNYWVNSSGAMATNAWVDGEKFYVGANGAWDPHRASLTQRQQWLIKEVNGTLKHAVELGRENLIKHLESDSYWEGSTAGFKFTHEEVVYAVDHAGVNWNEQARLAANQALERYAPYSYDLLVRHLESWTFTHDQAVYGVNHAKVNWNDQAAKFAQQALYQDACTRETLIEYLKSWGFSSSEVEYAASVVL